MYFCLFFLLAGGARGGRIKIAAGAGESIRGDYVSGELLVKFKGYEAVETVRIADPRELEKIIGDYGRNPLVEYAEPNFVYRASMIPSDPYYNKQWYLKRINAEEAWDYVRQSPDVIIAIVDSGVQIDHPDLANNIWRNPGEIPGNGRDDDNNGFIDDINGWDFVNNVADPSPKFKDGFTEDGVLHGTVVAGVAAASGNNVAGISGVTWGAKIMPLKVLDDQGEGNTASVIRAVDYAIANGAHIINFSFVGFGASHGLEAAIARAYNAGIIVVVAAGNEQDGGEGYFLDDSPMYPACHDGRAGENMVIGVAATDTIDQKAAFSSYGTKCVDISAPGISIYSTVAYNKNKYLGERSFDKHYDGYWSGTSMATPMVSAAAALVIESNHLLSRRDVVNTILDTAYNINALNPRYIDKLGRGRLDVFSAVLQANQKLSASKNKFMAAPFSGYGASSVIRIIDKEGAPIKEIHPFGREFKGGLSIASGDLNGDGLDEIIAAPASGGGPHIRIFDQLGNLKGQFFVFDKNFKGGINLAIGDFDGNGQKEIAVAPASGGGPHIRIFDQTGSLRGQFFAYDKNFRGGINLAAGDVNRDSQDEIVAAPASGGGPHIRIFDQTGSLRGQFFAYDKNFRGGVRVVAADIDSGIKGNRAEIITAPASGGGPHVKIFDSAGSLRGQFFAYDKKFRGGVNLAVGDADNSGLPEIVTGAGPGGTAHVRSFTAKGEIVSSFYAFPVSYAGGVNVGVIK